VFTGIVEELGKVEAAAARLVVACDTVTGGTDVGASIAVNGVCLTVVERSEAHLRFDLSPETLARTALGRLGEGDPVNLERPVTLAARLGGHLVQGHVDGVGEITALTPLGEGAELRVRLPERLERYVVEKGSVTLDGVSLTVGGVGEGAIGIALIPHTLAVTTFGSAKPGDPVNVEVDVIARYVERLMEART